MKIFKNIICLLCITILTMTFYACSEEKEVTTKPTPKVTYPASNTDTKIDDEQEKNSATPTTSKPVQTHNDKGSNSKPTSGIIYNPDGSITLPMVPIS